MQRTQLIAFTLLPLLLLSTSPQLPGRQNRKDQRPEAGPIKFTVETRESVVQFFEPLAIKVVLRNNSASSISFDPQSLKLSRKSWHAVGTWGVWSGDGDGIQLETADKQSGRIDLSPGATLNLFAVDEDPTFELLGPVRLAVALVSTDPATQKLLPGTESELSFEVSPTSLIAGIWRGQTESERNLVQPAFNDFLRLLAEFERSAQTEDDGFKQHRNEEFATRTLSYMGGYAVPFLNEALKDKDPVVREQALLRYSGMGNAIQKLDGFLQGLDSNGPRPQWAKSLKKRGSQNQPNWRPFAIAALDDQSPVVRRRAVTVLTREDWQPKAETEAIEFDAIKKLVADPDAGVRAVVQEYLRHFASDTAGADALVDSLADPEETVRQRALDALSRSADPPPLDVIKRGFAVAKGKTALGLIPLLVEQEDSSLPSTLAKDFAARSEAERLAILSAVAGYSDAATLDLARQALNDPSGAVQRAALMRLTIFSRDTAAPLIKTYLEHASPELRGVAEAVNAGLQSGEPAAAVESAFPSKNGTTPLVSPDGNWVAYLEVGWGRPGGSGGFGRSNSISITHVVRVNGTDDRVVSDMFLVSWLSDSQRVGTARDAFVAVTDLSGNVVDEFGDPLEAKYRSSHPNDDWTRADLRSQFGASMPHQKHLDGSENFGFGEAGSFSPDGQWYGPLQDENGFFLLAPDGKLLPLKLKLERDRPFSAAAWSPNGRYVQIDPEAGWLIIDVQTRTSHRIKNVDNLYVPDGGRAWSPWSKDGSQLTFVRDSQIWIAGPNGEGAKQITFDATQKAFPTFSRDGKSIAYLTWQEDNRRRYSRLGPTHLWVVDIASTLARRVTGPAKGRISSFDWLDDHTLIFDRSEEPVEPEKSFFRGVRRSSLHKLSLPGR